MVDILQFAPLYIVNGQREQKKTVYPDEENEYDKSCVITPSYAVRNIRAMMIHNFNTGIAVLTMHRSRRSNNLT